MCSQQRGWKPGSRLSEGFLPSVWKEIWRTDRQIRSLLAGMAHSRRLIAAKSWTVECPPEVSSRFAIVLEALGNIGSDGGREPP
jgi:hypothetical protein